MFDDELDRPKEDEFPMQETLEKSPGVYVRDHDPHSPHELDMLWGNARHLYKEERSHLLFFILGLLSGVLVSTAIFYLFVSKPAFLNFESKPSNEAQQAPAAAKLSLPGSKPEDGPSLTPPDVTGHAPVTNPAITGESKSYTVRPGDTLGKIAIHFYGDSSPDMVKKITDANNMKNPDALQLDQKLIIPPKHY